MAIPVFNLEVGRGGDITVTVDVTEADGTPSNLTGYTGTMQVRASRERDAELLASGTVTITALTGRIVGVVDGEDTEDAEWRLAHYDVRITNGSAIEYVAIGTIELRETVTHP